jgi:hypothetical protein
MSHAVGLIIVYNRIMFKPVIYINASNVMTVWVVGTVCVQDQWTQTWDQDIVKPCVPQEECT